MRIDLPPELSRPLNPIWWVVLLTLVGLGILFRLANLDSKGFWVDEAFTALRISGYTEVDVLQAWQAQPLTTAGELMRYQFPALGTSFWGTIQGLATFEPQLPPLYFILTRAWVEIWGDSVAVIRSFGALVSLATLPVMGLLCRELFPSTLVSYIAVGLMAVSPFQVLYAQEARPYSLWIFLTVLTSWLFLRALRVRNSLLWLAYGIALTLSLYTFVYTVFVVLAYGLYIAWLRMRPPHGPAATTLTPVTLESAAITPSNSIFWPFMLSSGSALLAFLPWVSVIILNGHQGLNLATWQRQPLDNRLVNLPFSWVLHISRTILDVDPDFGIGSNLLTPYGLAILAVGVGIAYAAYTVHQVASQETWRFLLLLFAVPALGVIVPDLLTGGQQSTVSRYFAPCWVSLTLVLASALVYSLRYPLGRLILVGVLTLGVLSCATSTVAPAWWNKQGGYIPYVAKVINHTPHPLVISSRDWWILSLAHALRPETNIQILSQTKQAPPLPPGYSDYFLYSIPPTDQEAISRQQGWQILPFQGLDQVPIACVFAPNTTPLACPPESD